MKKALTGEARLPGKAVAEQAKYCMGSMSSWYLPGKEVYSLSYALNGQQVYFDVPGLAMTALVDILAEFSTGNGVQLFPFPKELNTFDAPRVLGVPRVKFLRLLSDGQIPCTGVGRNRKVKLDDLIDYNEGIRPKTRSELLELIGVKE